MSSVEEVLAVILGGGRGSRLYPLTQQRSKPAVPIAGKYRLIDIPISNCINSGIYRVAILTQFNSVSLHRHISQTYQFDNFHQGWVQIWAAEQTMEHADWYQGTADAVRKQMLEISSTGAKNVLVLAGDHLYRMDYRSMTDFHIARNADVTVAVQPVLRQDANRFGLLKRDENGCITAFAEKPTDPAVLQDFICRGDPNRPYIGSMGIYLFKTEMLFELLADNSFSDFGADVIPYAIKSDIVYGYDFEDYWEDIGTIRSFYETNLSLTRPNPPFSFFVAQKPIYTIPRYLPGSTIVHSLIEEVTLAEGCLIEDSIIRHSIIGVRSQIRSGSEIEDTYIMGADYYERDTAEIQRNRVPLGIGRNCKIKGAIIDKNARVGDNVIIRPFPPGTDRDGENWVVRDGIVVIPKNAVVQPGTIISPD